MVTKHKQVRRVHHQGAGRVEPDFDVVVVGGGQAGLAAGRALQRAELRFTIMEAQNQVGGSWPGYYESLRLFSPARFSAMPGLPLPGDPGRHPTRDEIVGYLRRYAQHFELPVRTAARVVETAWDGARFTVSLADSTKLTARALIAAAGGFGRPHIPDLPGAADFTGRMVHVARYRSPAPFAGQRVVVVGAGNSAVQVAVELAEVARVTLATRHPIRFLPQAPLGVDIHYWTRWSGLEALPLGRRGGSSVGVLDTGRYAAAIAAGRPARRPMFSRLTRAGVVWADGTTEAVDAIVLATGYRPNIGFLAAAGALDANGLPVHCRGVSLTVPRLAYVGLPGQTASASATVRGVWGDARRVVRRLKRQLCEQQPAAAVCSPALVARSAPAALAG